jgi:arylsulfatase A-like enzyme
MQRLLDLYDGEIFFADEHAGRVLKALDDLGLKGRTLVIMTSDHGEEFAEHGGSKHGCTLFQEVMRVPLVLRLPGGAMAGIRIAERVSLLDLAPTILAVCGVEKPVALAGWNLCDLLSGQPVAERFIHGEVREVYPPPAIRARRDLVCAWKGNLKAIYDGATGQMSLFDLKADQAETHDLGADGGEKCEEFRRELARLWYACTQARLERAKESSVAGQPSGKSQTLRLLRGLGYTE